MTLRRSFLAVLVALMGCGVGRAADRPLNVLLITADDMNYDTPGCTGNKTPDITPNLDRLAKEGVRFAHADEAQQKANKYPSPSRVYKPDEITVPGFLPDLPDVRKEVAQYYSSAHRCDQTVGEILRALKETGLDDSTLVMFLSDNGMS